MKTKLTLLITTLALAFTGCAVAGTTHVTVTPPPVADPAIQGENLYFSQNQNFTNDLDSLSALTLTNVAVGVPVTVNGLPVGTNWCAAASHTATALSVPTPPVLVIVPANGVSTVTAAP